MFTLIRPVAALLLAVFAVFAAQAYEPLFDPEADLGRLPVVAAGVGAVVGFMFLGGRIGRAIWFSVFMAIQAVVLTAICTAMLLAVREIFIRGYRQQYDEVTEAVTGYFGIIVDWLSRGLVQDYLIFLALGGTAIGLVCHLAFLAFERRRNDRF